jgi:hypothetical protein
MFWRSGGGRSVSEKMRGKKEKRRRDWAGLVDLFLSPYYMPKIVEQL